MGAKPRRRFTEFIPSQMITVVSGLPRSGTSMMMNILEAGGMTLVIDGIRTADKDNPKGYYEFERVKKIGEGDVSWLPEARGKAIKIISYLLVRLPAKYHYRIIFMHRALHEVIASQGEMLRNRGQNPDTTSEEKLETAFKKHLDLVDESIRMKSNMERIDVHYNQLVHNPESDILLINRFLGDTLDTERMVQVIDPSLYRQRFSKRKE